MKSGKFEFKECDAAPIEGRDALAPEGWRRRFAWEQEGFSVWGLFGGGRHSIPRTLHISGLLQGRSGSPPFMGWIELEAGPLKTGPAVVDLYLLGTRPLPRPDITCISPHPGSHEYLVAGTETGKLLLLDARLPANLEVLGESQLPQPLVSLAPCGRRLLGLNADFARPALQVIATSPPGQRPPFALLGSFRLPRPLTALAEYDHTGCWGLSCDGRIYRIRLPWSQRLNHPPPPAANEVLTLQEVCRLGRRRWSISALISCLISRLKPIRPEPARTTAGEASTLAFDGRHFWTAGRSGRLQLYHPDGSFIRSFPAAPGAAVSSLGWRHEYLLALDASHQRLHLHLPADRLEPTAGLKVSFWQKPSGSETRRPAAPPRQHPGYLPAGSPASGGIHNLCLLYVGGEGRKQIHRYDVGKLRPLLGYLEPDGKVVDRFLDGFLMLAQYSPLLNGRSFGLDLEGGASRREDWIALFDEYFHPQDNLAALEKCAAELRRLLSLRFPPARVVLAVPTPDPRCRDWDGKGYSLAPPAHRVDSTGWAMKELLVRWRQAGYKNLELVGFYYMTEQGAWDDPVVNSFPRLCRSHGLRSFAIPGITSSWLTEFTRAGFDCVCLQPSHAFWQPPLRPRRHLLKCAGRIARQFGMGMEVELPYNVEQPAGREKVYDYLEMARLQGWAGAFKAYFQSFNLIKTLAESPIPEARQLYDDLYRFSRLSRTEEEHPRYVPGGAIEFQFHAEYPISKKAEVGRLNFEGHSGRLHLLF